MTPWFQGRGPMGLTPGQGTKIPHTLWHSQKKKKKKLREVPGKMRRRKRRKKKTERKGRKPQKR